MSGWMSEVIEHDLKVEDGYLLRPEAPGLGIDLNEKAAGAHPMDATENRHLRREDGSVQDW